MLFKLGHGKNCPDLVQPFTGRIPASEIERADCLPGAAAVWSMWPGYLEQPGGSRMRSWLQRHDVPLWVIHASGHASIADLQTLAAAIFATQVVPIHTATSERYRELIRQDGEWWPI